MTEQKRVDRFTIKAFIGIRQKIIESYGSKNGATPQIAMPLPEVYRQALKKTHARLPQYWSDNLGVAPKAGVQFSALFLSQHFCDNEPYLAKITATVDGSPEQKTLLNTSTNHCHICSAVITSAIENDPDFYGTDPKKGGISRAVQYCEACFTDTFHQSGLPKKAVCSVCGCRKVIENPTAPAGESLRFGKCSPVAAPPVLSPTAFADLQGLLSGLNPSNILPDIAPSQSSNTTNDSSDLSDPMQVDTPIAQIAVTNAQPEITPSTSDNSNQVAVPNNLSEYFSNLFKAVIKYATDIADILPLFFVFDILNHPSRPLVLTYY